jgi:hypothetical protein
MVHVKVSQLIAAAAIATVSVVGVAGMVDAAPAEGTASVATVALSTGASVVAEPTPTTNPSQLPRTGHGTDGVIIAVVLVGSGCVASLVSRRKTSSRHRL